MNFTTWMMMLAALWPAATAPQLPDTLVISDVSVLSMDGGPPLDHRTIIIANGRIIAVGAAGQVPIPRAARTIDGRGKWILPGLADMHVHLSTSEEFPLYVGNGVLTVRDLNGSPKTLAWRDSTAAGTLLGPRLFVSGPMIAGGNIPWSNKVTPTTAADADAVVVAQKRAGYDQIKIYDGLSKEVFAAAIGASKRVGMLSSGHIPQDVGFDGVLASGMNGLEHLDKSVAATVGHNLDTLQIPSIVQRIKQSAMWVTPTLESMVQLAKVSTGGYDSLMNRPEALSAPADLRDFWTTVTIRLKANRPPIPGSRYNPYVDYQFRLAEGLAKAGVPMLAGTDLPNVVLVPGYSLQDELDAMVEAGLTRYQVLEAATSAPARFFGQAADWGRVAVGQRANLVVVDKNPLDDLRTLRTPAGVVLQGRWLDGATLRTLRKARGAAPSPH
jgi:amidohydrolase family protein